MSVSPPSTQSLHEDALSVHLKHHPEDHTTKKPGSSIQLQECAGDCSKAVSSTSSSIKQSGSHHSCCDTLDQLQGECATISPSAVKMSPDLVYVNGHNCDTELSPEPVSIKEIGFFLPEDSGAHSLDASSSAVFCQENGLPPSASEQALSGDSHVVSTDSQVLSERTQLSASSDSPCAGIARRNGPCSKICGKLVDNFAARTNYSLKNASGCGPATSQCNKLTSLLSERLALSGDVDLTQIRRVESMNHCLSNGSVVGQLNGDYKEHSMKCEDLCHLSATLLAHREISRKLQEASGQLNGHYTDGSRMCKQVITAGSVEARCLHDVSPRKSLNCPVHVDWECSRASINSVSTDTLKGDLHPGHDDSASPSLLQYSKPLEVNTLTRDKLTVTAPLKPAQHSSSALKVSGYPLDTNETAGSNLVSRRARAASGASRDLSVSPCTCRRQFSDAARLLYPSGSELISRRILGATVATSTTDISDSHVAQVGVIFNIYLSFFLNFIELSKFSSLQI